MYIILPVKYLTYKFMYVGVSWLPCCVMFIIGMSHPIIWVMLGTVGGGAGGYRTSISA